jgi:hypothetical protein
MAVTVSHQTETEQEISPIDVTATVASGDTWCVALVGMMGSNRTVTSITFNSSAMDSLGSPLEFNGPDSRIYGYRFDVSGLGAGDYTVEATLSGGASDIVLATWVVAGAGTPTNWVTDTDSGTNPTADIAVTSAAGGLAIWYIAQDFDSALDPNGGEVEAFDGLGGEWYYSSGYHIATSGATTTSNIGITGTGTWYGVGLFVPASGGAPAAVGQGRLLAGQRNRRVVWQ